MSTPSEAALPLACVPGAIPAADRTAHFALLTKLFTVDARERRELPDGYAYRFDDAGDHCNLKQMVRPFFRSCVHAGR